MRITAAMSAVTESRKSPSKRKLLLDDGGMIGASTTADDPTPALPDEEVDSAGGDDESSQERPGIDRLPEEWEELVDQVRFLCFMSLCHVRWFCVCNFL